MLPYQQMGYDYFELFLRYDTTTFATNSDANTDLVAFGYVGLDFSYRNLAYNLRIIPVTLEDADSETVDEISWTVHNIHWQLFQDFDYGIFKHLRPGGQVGVTNLGLPRTSLSENTALANYLSSYYFSLEMHLFNNPRINVYYGMNFNSEVDMNSDLYIIESTGWEKEEDVEDHEIKFGVQLRDFRQVYNDFNGNLFWRKLNCKRDKIFYQRLRSAHSIVHNKPYDDYPNDWVKAKYHMQRGNLHKTDTFFCSALCTFIYVSLGLLPLNTEWTITSPAQLGTEVKSEGEKVKFIHCKMDNEVLIK